MNTDIKYIEQKARELRHKIVDTTLYAGGAHIGGAMSCADIMALLYFDVLNIDVENPEWEDRDRFILSKGHTAVAYIPALVMKGFLEESSLETFNHFKSPYGMHPDSLKINGCDVSSGSLGHGLSIAVGMGLAAKQQKKDFYTYCLMGDGECDEGSVWEAAMCASHYKLDNLIAFVDKNKCMIDGFTEDVMSLEPLDLKWKAFGFHTMMVDGHSIKALSEAIEEAKATKGKPSVIIMDTIKGKGIDFMEGDPKWHYGSMDSDLAAKARASIDREVL
jgi:transketolase